MKFVFALALVAICVMLMHARPNVKRAVDGVRVHKRADSIDESSEESLERGGSGTGNNDNPPETEGEIEEEKGEVGRIRKKRADSIDESSEESLERGGTEVGNGLSDTTGDEKENEGETNNDQRIVRSKRNAISKYVKTWPVKEVTGKSGTPVTQVDIAYKFEVDQNGENYGDKTKKGKALRTLVKEAVDEWNKKAGLNIYLDQSATEDVIVIKNGEGCWSWVGYQGKNNNELILEYSGCFSVGVIEHEFGHAIGLSHEAKRADARKHTTLNKNNIKDGFEDQFAVDNSAGPVSTTFLHGQDYDFCSIMHYSAKAFSKNGEETLKVNDPDLPDAEEEAILPCLGSQLGLTLLDTLGVATIYNTIGSIEKAESPEGCKFSGYYLEADSENCICSNLFEGPKCENPQTVNCESESNVFDLKSGEPKDFKTPTDGNQYPLDTICVWVFNLPKDHSLCLGFKHGYEIEEPSQAPDSSCAFDYFEVFFDPRMTMKTTRYCDVVKEEKYFVWPSESDFAAVKFKSDDMFTKKGFVATAVALPNSSAGKDVCKNAVDKQSVATIGNGGTIGNYDYYGYSYDYYGFHYYN